MDELLGSIRGGWCQFSLMRYSCCPWRCLHVQKLWSSMIVSIKAAEGSHSEFLVLNWRRTGDEGRACVRKLMTPATTSAYKKYVIEPAA